MARSSSRQTARAPSSSSRRTIRAAKTRTRASSRCRCSTRSSVGQTSFWSQPEMEIVDELLGYGARRIHHNVARDGVFRKGGHLAQVRFAASDHHDAIDAKRHPAVRRSAILERAHEKAEALLDLLGR